MGILSASGLGLSYGDVIIFSGITAEVGERARIGIVGPNGSGKTSFLRALVGELEPSAGSVSRSKGLRVGYVPQAPPMLAGGSLRDEVMLAFQHLYALEARMAACAQRMEAGSPEEQRAAGEEYAEAAHEFEARGGYTFQNAMERAVAGVGLPEKTLETPSTAASGGERTRAALARALLADPDLLVLDEPTNHLDLDGLAWLEGFLARLPHAFIAVSHDRYFLDKVATEIWELQGNRIQTYKGNYTRYREQRAELLLARQREYAKQQTYISKEEEFIRRYGAGQRSQQAQGRETRLARLQRVEAHQEQATVHIQRVAATRTSQVVLQTKGLMVGIPSEEGQELLLTVPDLKLERGSRTAIIGNNGAGKTTLLRTLLGQKPAMGGEATMAGNVKMGYYSQGLEDLPRDATVLEALREVHPLSDGEARAYLARFLFQGQDVFQEVRSLSGGERGRLALARILAKSPNFLCLDEPTNHLDIPSREALEEVLQAYEGTLLFVSHDRRLISLLADQLWVVMEGTVRPFAGGFEEWADSRAQAAATPAPKAKKVEAPRPARVERSPKAKEDRAAKKISDLEERLRELETGLQTAASAQDVAAIAKLGEEHRATQALLEEAWAAWMS